jgi:hypothetical protein
MMWLTPQAQRNVELLYDIRAAERLIMGKGLTSGAQYYDVVVTRQPTSGILVKLDYSRRNTKFSFDLHHRLSLDPEFVYPATIMTNIEVISGGTTSMGKFTISDTINAGDVFEEKLDKVSKADVDRYVTPFGRKRISLTTIPGSQSISIVGESVIVTRGTRNTRIETPGQRIAIVSNFKFEENRPGTVLE